MKHALTMIALIAIILTGPATQAAPKTLIIEAGEFNDHKECVIINNIKADTCCPTDTGSENTNTITTSGITALQYCGSKPGTKSDIQISTSNTTGTAWIIYLYSFSVMYKGPYLSITAPDGKESTGKYCTKGTESITNKATYNGDTYTVVLNCSLPLYATITATQDN